MWKYAAAAMMTSLLAAASTSAQTPEPAARPSVTPAATLLRVDEGVFELRQGRSVDLTNKKVLFTFVVEQDRSNFERGRFRASIAGYTFEGHVGLRFNLKDNGYTRDYVKDKDTCFLDVVDLVAPKGAPATVTLRLHCV